MSGIMLAAAGGVIGFDYVDHISDAFPALAVVTFAGASIGTAASGRRIIVSTMNSQGGSTALSSATIGGIAATIHVTAGAATNSVSIISALVPTGTTADIVLTYGSLPTRVDITIYAEYLSRALSTSISATTGTTTADVSLNTSLNGVTIAAGAFQNGTALSTVPGFSSVDYSNNSGSVTRGFVRDPIAYEALTPKTYQLVDSGSPTSLVAVAAHWA